MSPIALIGAGVLILLAGVALGYFLGNLGRKQEIEKTAGLQTELDEYRRNVTDHFSETAEQFQSLGEQYRRLYEHMAVGAESLCDPQQLGRDLSFAPVESLTSIDEPAEPVAPPGEEVEAAAEEVEPLPPQSPEVVAAAAEDEELVAKESSEELLAETEFVAEAPPTEKTYH